MASVTVGYIEFPEYEADQVYAKEAERYDAIEAIRNHFRRNLEECVNISPRTGSIVARPYSGFWGRFLSDMFEHFEHQELGMTWVDRSILEDWGKVSRIPFIAHSSLDQNRPEGVQTHFRFPDELKSYVLESGLPDNSLIKLDSLMKAIEELLKRAHVEYELTPGLFSDPEYPDSKGIKLTVGIKKELSYIYDVLKPEIYKAVWRIVPDQLEQKILIRFESLYPA